MGRSTYQFRETAISKKRTLNPAWRGVGCIVLVLLTVGAFWLAGYLLDRNAAQPFLPFTVPQRFEVQVAEGVPPVPGRLLVQIGAALFIDLVAYALMVVGYSIVNPIRPGATDAPQPRSRGRRTMTR
jgi:hypothetical protein